MIHPQHHIPTTTVQAYVATDGSLWLNEDECLEKNRLITWDKLNTHICENCETEQYEGSHSDHITSYIIHNFDEIKTILEK